LRGVSFSGYEKEFRDEISSESLNRNFSDIYNDISEAYTRNQYINNKLSEHVTNLSYANQMLNVRIGELNAAIAALVGDTDIMHWSAYDISQLVTSTCRQDLLAGIMTLEWARSWTKLQLVVNEYGEYESGNATRVAFDDGSEVYLDKPDSIYYAFDNNPETSWVKVYPTGGAPSSVLVRLEVPPSMNPAINSVYVSPFPDGGPSITDLEYLTNAGAWVPLITSPLDKKTRLHFSPSDYNNQIRFIMTPVSLLDSNGDAVKVFGMQDLDVSFIEYNNSGSFVIKLDASGNITSIKTVDVDYSITPSIDETIDNPLVVEVFEDAGLTTRCYSNLTHAHPYDGSISLSTSTSSLWVRVTMNRINNTTPVVNNITIKYD
jgi:hypothetical protein